MEPNMKFKNPVRVLIFDNRLRLVGIFQSYSAAERVTGIRHQILLRCCKGDMIASNGFYFREVPDDTIIDIDDLNELTVLEFDKQMGENRKIYATRNMRKDERILESQYNYRFQILHTKHKKNGKLKNQGN